MTKQPAPRQPADIADVAASVGYRELIDRLQRRVRESQAPAAPAQVGVRRPSTTCSDRSACSPSVRSWEATMTVVPAERARR
jgi:hypothetical protein